MKNKKFTALVLITMLLLSCVVTGCGKSITPKECAQVYWEIAMYDSSNATKLNMKADEAKAECDKMIKSDKKKIKDSYTAQKLTVTDEQIDALFNAIVEASKKANITIDEVSNDGKKAEVKYKTTYIDMNQIVTKAQKDAQASAQASGITNQKELMAKYSELFMANYVDGIKNATFSKDTKEKTFTFTKTDKVWIADKKDTMGQELGGLFLGQA